MFHYADPPVLLRDVFDDPAAVVGLLERNAPYTPLGGWFRPSNDDALATSPMWFQNDWAHADFAVEGVELFTQHERFAEAARRFYGAEVVIPHTVYVNVMAAMAACGPAHTDNPVFRGRNRTNTPMMLLRSMLWCGLFDRWVIVQATSIWWMNDVEGGGFSYWPDGPDKVPQHYVGEMANTALVGDNHGMFHQVEPVGPFDEGTRLVNASAELAPANDGTGDWAVRHEGVESYRAPLDAYRVSVLWKADIYSTEAERRRVEDDTLSLDDVARIYNEDLTARGADLRVRSDRLDDPGLLTALATFYPEAVPVGAGASIFDG